MADADGIDDLLEGMDDLDAALFGKSVPKKPAPPNMLTSILANQSNEGSRRATVKFAEPEKPKSRPSSSKASFDDLFSEPTTTVPQQSYNSRESRRTPTSNLSDLFGTRRNEPEPSVPNVAPVSKPEEVQPTNSAIDSSRITRLEAEIDRLNRELEDLKKRKRDDEEDLEKMWKDRVSKIENELNSQMTKMQNKYLSQIEELEKNEQINIEKIKSNYERQFENLTASLDQTRDITTVVEKVDNISTTIGKIAEGVTSTKEKLHNDQDVVLRVREEKLELREERLQNEILRFEEERKKVLELNIRLNELCKQQESSQINDKWKIKEEWNRLEAEKHVFQEDQKFVLENLSKEKALIENKITLFHQEQHDLLVRMSTERQLFEQEKNEFYSKRNIDIRRLKDEAAELDLKIQQVSIAEQSISETKLSYESKMRQLQDLEVSLMEECAEIDRLRNHLKATIMLKDKNNKNGIHHFENNIDVEYSARDSNRKNESVRATLRKHSEYLDKYVGQKVAAIAPQNN